jgi:hypothetical protein
MAANARLAEILGPPETTPSVIDWIDIERRLGLMLPADYVQWAESYTSLYIDGFLRVLHPVNFFSRTDKGGIGEDLMGVAEMDPPVRMEVYDSRGRILGEELPAYPCYPSENGLVPWGNTDNGDLLLWISEGNPESWQIVVVDGDSHTWQEFECGFSEFLVGLFEAQFSQVILPTELRPAIQEFQGYQPGFGRGNVPIWRPTSRWVEYFDQRRAERERRNRPPG